MDRSMEPSDRRGKLEVLVAVGLVLCFCGIGTLFFRAVAVPGDLVDLHSGDLVFDFTVSAAISVMGVILIAVGLLAGRG